MDSDVTEIPRDGSHFKRAVRCFIHGYVEIGINRSENDSETVAGGVAR